MIPFICECVKNELQGNSEMNNLFIKILSGFALIFSVSATANAGYTLNFTDDAKGEIGIWAQSWYQYREKGKNDERLHDFMVRRLYLNFKGEASPIVGFFLHVAADRIGQEGLDTPSLALGSGLAFRDAWISFNFSEAFKVQFGRMYIPLTRNYGTTSTKSLLTTDLAFLQGGVRGSIFYAGKVGRDDGVTIWGNPFDGSIQYRFMVSEGVEEANNVKDNLRYAGRVSLNLLEPEKGWFNKGTYLGKKKVLAIGGGIDHQQDLTLNGKAGRDNFIWTVDLFLEHPVGTGAVTLEAAYIDIENCTQTHNLSNLAAGDDAANWYGQAGYLLPGQIGSGQLQPYLRYETVSLDRKTDTQFSGGGINYYIKGDNAKISLDYSFVNQEEESTTLRDHSLMTFQFAVGF